MKTVFSNNEIPGRIHALQPFLSRTVLPDGTRAWSGHSGPAITLGHLPRKYHHAVRQAVYVVYSYETPIAWVNDQVTNGDEAGDPYLWFVVPDVGYSPTTGQQQYACREAWADELKRQGTYRRFPASGREVVHLPATAEAYGVPRHPRSGGVDGFRPGSVIGRTSAYEGTGDDASHWSPLSSEYQKIRDERDRLGGYIHPAHP